MNTPSRFTFHVLRFSPILALTAFVLLFFHRMALSNLILARGDTFLYFYPYWDAAAAALRNGRVPLWNPHLFMGAPFLANSQVGFFYPLNWPVWWLLATPYAVSASIVLHVLIAGGGAYLAGRRALSLSRSGAWLVAILFALGGYLTAQVEHINQLQGLAWLPWFLVVLGKEKSGHELHEFRELESSIRIIRAIRGKKILGRGTAVAALFSLQLLAGHTQTAFITGVGVVLYLVSGVTFPVSRVTHDVSRLTDSFGRLAYRFLPLVIGVGLAGLMTAVQLLPTLELTQYSSRQGGLAINEVLSFSLHPLLLGRSFLPGYGQSLFTEYVAFLPLTALFLAGVGLWQWRWRPGVQPIVVVTAVAFILALGRFTPVYWLLARLPGFDLFRVPARWLIWYALGMALLAGLGWDVVRGYWRASGEEWRLVVIRPLRWTALLIILLIGWSWLAVPLVRFVPLGSEVAAEYPSWLTVIGWSVELVLVAFLLGLRFPMKNELVNQLLLPLIAVASLLLASRSQPYNQLTTPEAYFDLRPPIARLQAAALGETVPGRLLSLSSTFFDPGDQAEIDTIYTDQLSAQARYDYTVAIKQKEILAPNLPLAYGLSSVDGFDGGILPLDSYSQLMQTILPEQGSTVDGRLREYLTAVPQPQWLDLFNARYLITDKTGDVWREIVPPGGGASFSAFFDLQHPATIAAGESLPIGYLPDFPASAVALIADGAVGEVMIEAGGETLTFKPALIAENLWLAIWPSELVPQAMTLRASSGGAWSINGVTLLNLDEQTFQPLVPGHYRLLHSGDVKLYENLDVLPRAFLVTDWAWVDDAATAVAHLQSDEFDPRETAVLLGEGAAVEGRALGGETAVNFVAYEPEKVVLQVTSSEEALLVLTDAYYPGWEAAVDGQPLPIYQADVLFRAIIIPAGQHEVTFSFVPPSYKRGLILSLLGFVGWMLLVGFLKRTAKDTDTATTLP